MSRPFRAFNTAFVLVVTILILSTAPASAAGYFTFDANFGYSLKSRTWSQASGSTIVRANISCDNGYDNGKYTVTLYKKGWYNQKIGSSVYYACNRLLQYTWTGLNSGDYYFVLGIYNAPGYAGTGNVTYP